MTAPLPIVYHLNSRESRSAPRAGAVVSALREGPPTMKLHLRYTATLILAGALLIGATPQESAANTYGPAAVRSLLYVGLFNSQVVNVYDVSGTSYNQIGQLADGVSNPCGGLAVDPWLHLYIPQCTSATVFQRDVLVPTGVYLFPGSGPGGIAAGADGEFYVPLFSATEVLVYPKGVRKPSLTIPMPTGASPVAVAADAGKNVYVQYRATTGGHNAPQHIEKCPPGSTQCTDLGITLGSGGVNLAIDSLGNLVACDFAAEQIDVFAPGAKTPTRTISTAPAACQFFALDAANKRIFMSPQATGPESIYVYDYATGHLITQFSTGIPSNDYVFGVALSPSAH